MKTKGKNKIIRSAIKEWGKALAFALILALIFRGLLFQSYVVSTTKMEKTLLVGDYLVVNKLKYGARLPITLLSLPFFENYYYKLIQLPYLRLPGYGKIETNELLVFNYPASLNTPIDKKETVIKRCIALPGDTLQIIDKKVFVNNHYIKAPKLAQYSYRVKTQGKEIDQELLKKYAITEGGKVSNIGIYDFPLSYEVAEQINNEENIRYVRELKDFKGENSKYIFPTSKTINWNKDYFGPLITPSAGQTIELTAQNIDLYRTIIEVYEQNTIKITDNKIFINNIATNCYTIKSNYYFVMDDNRDHSKDSRQWGFVPDSHIIGTVKHVWLSIDKNPEKIRWKRLLMNTQE